MAFHSEQSGGGAFSGAAEQGRAGRRAGGSPEGEGPGLERWIPALSRFSSTRALEASPLYARLKPALDRMLGQPVQGDLACEAPATRPAVRVTAWNIERGLRLEGVLRALEAHPVIRESDLFLLTELDCGMARSRNRFVAREIARALGLNYVFVSSYLNLTKGSGLEQDTNGENAQGLHGNALFSRYPLSDAHGIPLENGKDKMRGKEKRLGRQQAVVATVAHPLGPVRAVCLHLDAHSTRGHRVRQMKAVLDHLDGLSPGLPVVIGGDWNTSTYNSNRALFSILGYARRVLMGVGHVIRDHYPYPDRWFERPLFRALERRGYRYRDLNEPGGCTLHYDVADLAANGGLADWVPQWCFWFINWALREHGGRCSFKLDWFAGRGIRPVPAFPPRVLGDVRETYGPCSDHDPIVLDFVPEKI